MTKELNDAVKLTYWIYQKEKVKYGTPVEAWERSLRRAAKNKDVPYAKLKIEAESQSEQRRRRHKAQ